METDLTVPNRLGIKQLPVEVMSSIFRRLDGRSLVNASRVCREWFVICRTDPVLRWTVRRQELKRRQLRWCRARYGDGRPAIVRRACVRKGRRGGSVLLRRKIRVAQYKCLLTLTGLKNMWESFYYYLLFYDRGPD